MVQESVKKWQKSTIICRGLIYQAQFFKPCSIFKNSTNLAIIPLFSAKYIFFNSY